MLVMLASSGFIGQLRQMSPSSKKNALTWKTFLVTS